MMTRCEEPLVWFSGAQILTSTLKQCPKCHLGRANSVNWDGPVNVHFYQAHGSCRAGALPLLILQMKPCRGDRYTHSTGHGTALVS